MYRMGLVRKGWPIAGNYLPPLTGLDKVFVKLVSSIKCFINFGTLAFQEIFKCSYTEGKVASMELTTL